jgi:CO/xanthine dehydrogenase FAD-binding subunit
MHPFAYARPASLPEALALLDEHGSAAVAVAGGTDLVVSLRNGTIRPRVVIDLKAVAELQPSIDESDAWLTISATQVMTGIVENDRVRAAFPALCWAAAVVGSIQIRNRATLAGNVCHASPAADTPPVLLVYGTEVNIASARGSRRVPLEKFYLGPGKTVLQRGELVTSIDLPLPAEPRGVSFARMTRRRGVDLATVNLCCSVDSSGRTQFAYGAVGPRPFLVADESGVLADAATSAAEGDEVLRQLLTQASPISDVRGSRDYREAMLLVMSRRALRTSIDRLAAAI